MKKYLGTMSWFLMRMRMLSRPSMVPPLQTYIVSVAASWPVHERTMFSIFTHTPV